MTHDEAKFILSAYRPNGSDSGNPAFSEVLRMAGEDPALGSWLAHSRAHDTAVADRLRQLSPPPGLREAILAGVRMGVPRTRKGMGWSWVAGMAAAAVLAIGVFSMRAPARPEPNAGALGAFAVDDVVRGGHVGLGEPSAELVSRLEIAGAPLPTADQIDFEKLRATGCRTLSFAGHDVLELCFKRQGTMFHLYIARREGSVQDSSASGPSFVSERGGGAAVWSDAHFEYALASLAGVEALRHLL